MVPNKFEESIKNRLENRTITPSHDAWTRLEERLDASDNKNNNKIFWWIGIAATMVGVFFAITILSRSDESLSQPVLVEEQIKDVKTKNTKEAIIEQSAVKQIAETEIQEKSAETNKVKSINKITSNKKQPANDNTSLVLGITEKSDSNIYIKNEDLNTVLATVSTVNNTEDLGNTAEAYNETNLLLEQAQKKLARNKINEHNQIVDANSLLESVEDELDDSFRDKIFETLKSGYISVKTAVVNRND